MINLKHTLTAAAAALMTTGAMALPSFTVGTNSINFVAYENQYRSAASCAATGNCLAGTANDPAGYFRVDPASTGFTAVIPGDLFIGILKVTQTQPSNWGPTPTDNFTGYFVQEVAAVSGVVTNAKIDLKASAIDPFATGKLAAGEMFALFTDSTTNFNPNGTTASTIALATDGTKWAGLGLSSATETYAYTLDNLTISGADPTQALATKSYMALDILNYGASYNAGLLAKVNDLSEALVGGTPASGQLTCAAGETGNADAVFCSDLVGNADVKRNANFPTGLSPWFFEVNDPLSLSVIPEPGTLALAGLALLAVGGLRRRQAAK